MKKDGAIASTVKAFTLRVRGLDICSTSLKVIELVNLIVGEPAVSVILFALKRIDDDTAIAELIQYEVWIGSATKTKHQSE